MARFDASEAPPYLASRARSSASMAGGTGAEAIGPISETPAEPTTINATPSAGPVVDPGDDPANFLERLDAQGDKRRQRRILSLSGWRQFSEDGRRVAAGDDWPFVGATRRRTATDRRGRWTS